jgi:hypothetical protein
MSTALVQAARWRLEAFDGPHRWLPTELATRAIAWFGAVAATRGAEQALTDAARLRTDERFANVRDEDGFKRALERLKGDGPRLAPQRQ